MYVYVNNLEKIVDFKLIKNFLIEIIDGENNIYNNFLR